VRAHPNGAYETGPAGVTQIVISSVNTGYRGYAALTAREVKTHGIDDAHFAQGSIYTNMCGAGCQDKMALHWTGPSKKESARGTALTPRSAASGG
jgi:hypothetical protein